MTRQEAFTIKGASAMRSAVFVLLMAFAVVVGMGVYLNWVNFSMAEGTEGKPQVRVTHNPDKAKSDVSAAGEKVGELTDRVRGEK